MNELKFIVLTTAEAEMLRGILDDIVSEALAMPLRDFETQTDYVERLQRIIARIDRVFS